MRPQPAPPTAIASTGRLAPAIRCHRVVFAALLWVAIGFSAAAQGADNYYRWKDERGNLVVSDRPPDASIDYEVFSTASNRIRRVNPGEGAVPAETTSRPGNRFQAGDSADDGRTMESVAIEIVPEKDPDLCDRARRNLDTLETAARIRVRDEAGELHYLTEDDIATQRQNALDNIDVYCD